MSAIESAQTHHRTNSSFTITTDITMYDTSILYPIVHDLSEAEEDPSSPQNVTWCSGGGCFDLRELLIPCDEPRLIWEESCANRQRSSSIDSTGSATEVSLEERSYVPPRPERFQDAYVLTRQVRHDMTYQV